MTERVDQLILDVIGLGVLIFLGMLAWFGWQQHAERKWHEERKRNGQWPYGDKDRPPGA